MLIFCNGMRRSGSTYQYNLTRLVVDETGKGQINAYQGPPIHPARTWPPEQLIEWIEDDLRHIVKPHEVHPLVAERIADGGIRVVYIHRDIRDVAASVKRVRGLRGPALIDRVTNAVEAYYELSAIREKAGDYLLWQRYEEATRDPVLAARQVADTLSIDVDEDAIQRIAAECSVDASKERCDAQHRNVIAVFNELRRDDVAAARAWLGQVQRGERIVQDPEFLLPHNHVSKEKGASGVWKDVLSAEEANTLVDLHHDWFAHAGYSL